MVLAIMKQPGSAQLGRLNINGMALDRNGSIYGLIALPGLNDKSLPLDTAKVASAVLRTGTASCPKRPPYHVTLLL
jgi:hypothetical protein